MQNNQTPGAKPEERPEHWGRSLLDLLLLLYADRFVQRCLEVFVKVLGLHFHVPQTIPSPIIA
jgi:hypothetical protein